MLTSSANQYLRPEYLTPLPTTLDAKKSPLALLAQTCSQIGVDPPTGKSLLSSQDKSNKSLKSDSSSREKSSPAAYNNSTSSSSSESMKSSSFKPYESCLTNHEKASSPDQQRVSSVHSNSGSSNSRSRTPGNNSSKRCSSNQSASSSSGRAITPQGRKSTTPGNDTPNTRESPSTRMSIGPNDAVPLSRSASSNSPASKLAYSSAQGLSQDLSLGNFRPVAMSLSSSTSGSATTTTTPSETAYGLPYPPQLPPMDAMTASSLMSQHHAAAAAAALKNGLAAHPYLSYARMKTPTGADTLVPVCRDPYCTGCQLNSHLLATTSTASAVNGKIPTSQANGTCPAGCAQCDHKTSPSAAAAAAAAAAASSPYAAYAHAQLVALAAASQMPYVCNWIGADTAYCGKRFATSDELLNHFKIHTTGPQSGASEQNAATTAAALSLLGPGHPLLSRTYPTPPLSPLASARYHPYGKPYGAPGLSSLGLPLPPPPHPAAAGLPPYFSPYSLYAGSRLGAASGMHP